MTLSNEALEAAAVSAETWDPEEHGDCDSTWYYYYNEPDGFLLSEPPPTAEHG